MMETERMVGTVSPGLDREMQNRAIPFGSWSRHLAESASGLALLLVLWQVIATMLHRASVFPGPWPTLLAAGRLIESGTIQADILSSLSRVFEGFILAAVVAIPLGGAMGIIPWLRRIAHPVIELIRPIPPIAVIPLSILWFGIGNVAQVFIVFYGAFFPMVVGVYGAFVSVDNIYGQAAETLGCHGVGKFRRVTLMAALPSVLTATRIGLGLSFVALVAAELIGASSGLGYLVATSGTTFQTADMFVGILTIGVIGFGLNAVVEGLTKVLIRY